MSKAQWREFVGDVNGRLKRSRGSSHYWLVGQILTVPFFLAARKRRSKRRGKMFHALCEEFNERFAGKLELVYSKKLDPRYVQRATTGAHVCTAVDRSQD